jgi:hypothetical protein
MKTKKTAETPGALQQLLVITLIIAWLVSIAQLVGIAAMQYGNNQNLSSFVSWALMTIGTPLVLVLVIYFTRKRKQLSLNTMFEVAIASVAALAIYSSLTLLSVFTPPPIFNEPNSVLYYQLMSSVVPLVITAIVMLVILIRLRRRSQW